MRAVALAFVLASAAHADAGAEIEAAWVRNAKASAGFVEQDCPGFERGSPLPVRCAVLDAYARYEIVRGGTDVFTVSMTIATTQGPLKISFTYAGGSPWSAYPATPGGLVGASKDGWLSVIWPAIGDIKPAVHLFIDPGDPFSIQTQSPDGPVSAIKDLELTIGVALAAERFRRQVENERKETRSRTPRKAAGARLAKEEGPNDLAR